MKLNLIAFTFSAVFSTVLGCLFIPLLKKLKVGQTILSYVKEHSLKNGTPTMGGVIFTLSAIIVFILLVKENFYISIVTISIVLAYLIVGFIDDFIKIKTKNNQGLTAIQKLIFQLSIALIASVFAYKNGFDFLYLPFTKNTVYLGWASIILNFFVFIATVNAVNLTDGLDGLCSSVSYVVFLAIGFIIYLQTSFNSEIYVNLQEYQNLTLFCTCFAGALVGFLLFNTNKASVFMGDTGSLAIGGGIASVCVFSGNTLYIPIICVTFVFTVLSVIIQVLCYKKTKKRVFLMSPFHHHLEQKGLNESKISYVYFFITLMISLLVIIFLI